MTTRPTPVLIVGAGPVGLTAAMRLGHLGIDCRVIEADAAIPRDLRASTFHPPTLDMLEPYGITPRLIDAGLKAPTWQVRWHTRDEFAEFDLSILRDHTRHPYRVQCEQWRLAEFLLEHIRNELPRVEVLQGHRCVAVRQDAHGVSVDAVDPSGQTLTFRGDYLIGADGARSLVRGALDLAFDGITFPETTVLATTPFRFHEHIPNLSYINYCWYERGTFSLLRLPHVWRVSLYPAEGETVEEATAPESIQRKLQEILPRPEPYEVQEVRPYRIHQRVVTSYVHGRIVLAGDAAHINSPSGGMGMNGGIHDAFNLADKLVAVIHEGADAALLDRYERQRRGTAIEYINANTARNKKAIEERDPALRRRHQDDLRAIAADPNLARDYLRKTSMIDALRRAEAIA